MWTNYNYGWYNIFHIFHFFHKTKPTRFCFMFLPTRANDKSLFYTHEHTHSKHTSTRITHFHINALQQTSINFIFSLFEQKGFCLLWFRQHRACLKFGIYIIDLMTHSKLTLCPQRIYHKFKILPKGGKHKVSQQLS